MKWTSRPKEVKNLFNPAFCGEILRRCIYSHAQYSQVAFPFPLIFLVLPLVLDKSTREKLPQKIMPNTHFLSWLQNNQSIRIQFPQRAKEMKAFAKEAFIFLVASKSIEIDFQGNLSTKNYSPVRLDGEWVEEVKDCFKKAENVGKLFSEVNNPSLLYASLDVRP